MKKRNIATTGWLLSTLLFHVLFWQQKLGLNVGIFQLFNTGLLIWLYPSAFKAKTVQASTLLTLAATGMIIWHNSFISKFAYFGSLGMMISFIHQPRLQSIVYACAQSIHSILRTVAEGIQVMVKLPKTSGIFGKVSILLNRHLKLIFIPALIFIVFFGIFKMANPVFNQMTNQGFNSFIQWLAQFAWSVSPVWLGFMGLGMWLTAYILFNWRNDEILQKEQAQNEVMVRFRKRPNKDSYPFHMSSLRQEYKIGLLTIASVNVLLLVINAIDIRFIWLSFDYEKAGNLTHMVHEGTYLLILSILLAMGILLYFFRRNINFYPANSWLKKLAYAWIVQNVILVISVALRTIYYIQATGLAYKRIGVLIFLCLTVFGLYTMFRKINRRKSVYYLWKLNSWAAYIMMVLMSLVNWDRLIVQHNYAHSGITSEFMLTRSVRTLDLLDQYFSKQSKAIQQKTMRHPRSYTSLQKNVYLTNRIKGFVRNQASYSWLSWNYADWRTRQYFAGKKNIE